MAIERKMKKTAPLQNEFRWSVSRQSCYEECPKRYWYSYYGSWDGWPKNAFDPNRVIDPLAALLYRLKQIQTLPLYVGSIVHKSLETSLTNSHKNLPSVETLQAEAIQRFRKGIKEAQTHKWKDHPKKFTNLAEWYYESIRNKAPPGDDELKIYEEKIHQMVASWRNSPAITQLILAPDSRWSGIEKNIEFLTGGTIPTIVVIDFMLYWPTRDGDILIIFDWKTGGERKENIEQLYAYALAATRHLNQPLDKIIISPFYLAQGATGYKKFGYKQAEPLDPKIAERLESQIVQEGQKLLNIHKTDQEDPLKFAYTEERGKCQNCPFIEVCQKAEYAPLSKDELRMRVT